MATSIRFIQKDKPKSDGTLPVFLRIIKDRKSKIISMGFSCKPNQWDEKAGRFKQNYLHHSKQNELLAKYEKRALRIIDTFRESEKDFTLTQFEALFRQDRTPNEITVFAFWQEKIDDLRTARKESNARVYDETRHSFFSFTNDKKLLFTDLTARMLEKYEVFLRGNGGTGGGISVKMRTLRALYNSAIKNGYAAKDNYPFDQYKISDLKGGGIKKALTRDEMRIIEALPLDQYPHLTNARHFFVFSYYTRGMNFFDMLLLTWENVLEDRILYTRSKTGESFVVKILPPVREILDYYKSKSNGTAYVFPILLKDGMTAAQIENRRKKVLKQFNKDLKAIARITGIRKPLSSYVARHTFATNLKQAGVSIAVISEAMGHSDVKITETYLKDFENEVVDTEMEKLL